MLQACGPVSDLKVLTAHCAHEAPLGPVHPALQRQLLDALLASDEEELPGHASHEFDVDATTVEKVCCGHFVHGSAPSLFL